MHGFTDSTLPSPNAFTSTFLQRLGERDEPPAAGEADAAGPWHVEEIPGEGFGLFRLGESRERGFRPAAVFRRRFLALLAAAVLPGTGRDAAFRLAKEAGPAGFAVEAGNGGEVVGLLRPLRRGPDLLPPRGGQPRPLPRVAGDLPGSAPARWRWNGPERSWTSGFLTVFPGAALSLPPLALIPPDPGAILGSATHADTSSHHGRPLPRGLGRDRVPEPVAR